MITFTCASCRKKLVVKEELAGKRVQCPGCRQPALVPPAAGRPKVGASDFGEAKTAWGKGRAGAEEADPRDRPATETSADPSGEPDSVATKAFAGQKAKQELTDFLAPAEKPDEIGRLGPYRVLRILGAGGMGVVFQAEDPGLQRLVALKAMRPSLASSPLAKERFFREARSAAALKHPNIVTIFQVGEDRGTPFLAMEFLEGESLDDRLKRQKRLALADILRIGRQIAEGLAAAHAKDFVHRDIKPGNIWLESVVRRPSSVGVPPSGGGTPAKAGTPTDQTGYAVKLLDFGLARALADQTELTQSGAVIGTPAYMAPEQADGTPVDHRCDLFSLGCILYQMCTGELPFKGNTTMKIFRALAVANPTPVWQLRDDVPEALSDLVDELLAKTPEERPASAQAVLERLGNIEALAPSVEPPTPIDTTAATKKIQRDDSGPETEQTSPGRRSKRRKSRDQSAEAKRSGKLLAVGIIVAGASVVTVLVVALLIFNQASPKAAPAGPGERVYLSTLEPSVTINWPILPPPPPGKPPLKGIGAVRIQGKPSPHGIFMHPPRPPQDARLGYNIAKQYAKFHSEVSFNDGPPFAAPCTFFVYGDGKVLWKSAPVSSQADAQACSVDVSGVSELTIAVSCAGEPKGAHAVWLEPHLTK
jgi:serine/threonine protein kinase